MADMTNRNFVTAEVIVRVWQLDDSGHRAKAIAFNLIELGGAAPLLANMYLDSTLAELFHITLCEADRALGGEE